MSQSNPTATANAWTVASSNYGSRVGSMSSDAATQLLQLAATLLPIESSSSHVLDHGAGTGALSRAVAAHFPGTPILATDISPGMLAVLSSAGLPNVRTYVLDACIPDNVQGFAADQTFSHAFSCFMLQFAARPAIVLDEMFRVLRPGGVLALGIWGENNDPINIWREACLARDGEYVMPPPYQPEAWKNRDEIEAAAKKAGFREVWSEVRLVPLRFEGLEAYLAFWFQAKNPVAVGLVRSWSGKLEEVEEAVKAVLRDKYDEGRRILIEVVLTLGRKIE